MPPIIIPINSGYSCKEFICTTINETITKCICGRQPLSNEAIIGILILMAIATGIMFWLIYDIVYR